MTGADTAPPLIPGPLGLFAALYEAMWTTGHVTPDTVDRMEVWQVASALGVRPDAGIDLLAARVAAAREGRPPPDVPRGQVPTTVARRSLRAE